MLKLTPSQIWGDAYSDVNASSFVVSTFSAARHNPTMVSHLETTSLYSYSTQQVLMAASLVQLPDANEHPMFYVGIFAAIGLGGALVATLSSYVQLTGALKASRRLFQQLLVGVVRATMRWHDVTPQGKVSYLTGPQTMTER
jgi:ABC-type multidrug transport system fused ATPase/permease subunit